MQSLVRYLLVHKRLRDDPDHLSSFSKNRICHSTHKADRCATVDKTYPGFHEQFAELIRCSSIFSADAPT